MTSGKFRRATGIAAFACILSAAPALAQQTARIGALECDVSAGAGVVITSTKALDCHFFRETGQVERYVGTIKRFGLDLGATGPGHLDWVVFAPSTGGGPGALAGDYGGVGASATPGVGIGANALIGGSNRTVSLQPFSVQAQTGIDIAAGVTALEIEFVPTPVARPPVPRHRR